MDKTKHRIDPPPFQQGIYDGKSGRTYYLFSHTEMTFDEAKARLVKFEGAERRQMLEEVEPLARENLPDWLTLSNLVLLGFAINGQLVLVMEVDKNGQVNRRRLPRQK